MHEALVIGAGPAGLASSAALKRRGVEAMRIERVAGGWRVISADRHFEARRVRQWGLPADLLGVLGQTPSPRVSDPQARLLRRISIGDLAEYGLPLPRAGMFAEFRRERQAPSTVDREVIHAIRARRIEIVSAVERFDGRAVLLADGSRVEPDAVIAATGYERALEPLVGHLGVLDDDGLPVVHGAETHPGAPDLHFVGFDPRIPGTFRQIRIEPRRLRRAA